jgi:hypothetical protein
MRRSESDAADMANMTQPASRGFARLPGGLVVLAPTAHFFHM